MSGPQTPSYEPEPPRGDQALRQAGRDLLLLIYAGLRSLKLYPLENAQVQKALDDLQHSAEALLKVEDEIEIRRENEFIFINGTRLRLELENYASFSHVLTIFRSCDVGMLRVEPGVERKEWQVLLSLLLAFSEREDAGDKIIQLTDRLGEGGARHLEIAPPVESEEELAEEERRKEAAKRTYTRSVAVTKEVINSVRMGRTASIKKVKRAVQAVVDQVLNNETSIIGLTTIRDYDEYTFTHSVNVCIFAVALGRKIGLTRLQLYDLGVAALMHDVGKSRVPLEVLNKTGGLTDDEWRIMQAHPWLGVLTLFAMRGYGEIPYRAMVVAHEHHMKIDLTGYPKTIRPRDLSIFSKIVAAADGFDAATTRRSYQTVPIQPDEVLREMWENPRRGYDPVIVKALINLIGIYPVGTCVILDTYEIGVVHAVNPDAMLLNRPLVRVAVQADGTPMVPGQVVDLGERDANGSFVRSIIKVTDPVKYGITVGDAFV